MPAADSLEQLHAEARYHRQRYDLYRAKLYRGGATTPSRLRELERTSEGAVARLRAAQRRQRPEQDSNLRPTP